MRTSPHHGRTTNLPAHLPEHPVVSALIRMLCSIEERTAVALARLLSAIVIFPLRMRVRLNVQKLLGVRRLKHGQYRQIVRDYVNSSGAAAAMFCRFPIQSPDDVLRMMPVEGEHHLAEAVRNGKGTVLIADHMGPFCLTPYMMSALGYKVTVVLNPNVQPVVDMARKHFNITTVAIGDFTHAAMADTLRNNGIVFLWCDICQPGHMDRGVWLPLGEGELLVDRGPGIIARRHAGALLRIQCRPTDDGAYVMTIAPLTRIRADGEMLTAPEMHASWIESLHQQMIVRPGAWWPLASLPLRKRRATRPGEPRYVPAQGQPRNADVAA